MLALWNWAATVRLWVSAGGDVADLPVGTTNVEGGFFGLREDAFVTRQTSFSAAFFERAMAASCLSGNFAKAWQGRLPPSAAGKTKRWDVQLTCAALLSTAHGEAAREMEESLRRSLRKRSRTDAERSERSPAVRSRGRRRRRERRQLPTGQ